MKLDLTTCNIVKSSEFCINVVDNVEKKIKRNLTNFEEDAIVMLIKELNPAKFINSTLSDAINFVTKISLENLRITQCNYDTVDIHEMMKLHLGTTVGQENPDKINPRKDTKNIFDVSIDSIFGLSDIATLVKKVREPAHSINHAYFLLDTKYRVLETDGTTNFKWTYMNSTTQAQGTCNAVCDIRDIVTIKIMPHRIPAVATAITPYKRISMYIEEIPIQSFISHDRRFHFIGDTKIQDEPPYQWVEIDPSKYYHGEYKFNKPITHIDTMTINYATPLESVIFDKDRLLGTVTIGNSTTIVFTESHNINNNELVYIDNFTTTNPLKETSLRDEMNTPRGLIATVVSPEIITVPVDTGSLSYILTGTVNSPISTLVGFVQVNLGTSVIIGTGTSFTTDFVKGDYILIYDTNKTTYQISKIISNTELVIVSILSTTIYNNEFTPQFSYGITSNVIKGNSTIFMSELQSGDHIIINYNNIKCKVLIVLNNTTLILDTPFTGDIGVGLLAYKNNTSNQDIVVFFGSKRIFIPIEITYLSSSI